MESDKTNDRLVNENIGLVHACANRFRGRGIEYEELFSSGCVGLVKAAKNFDETRGFAFSTYAVPVILGEIKRIFRDGGTVKVGRTMKEKARQAMKKRQELEKELMREPTVSELAESMGIDVTQASELVNLSMPVISLTSDDDGRSRQLDVPVDSPDGEITDRLSLKAVIDRLDERDRRLILLRYFEGMTQTKTALELGMSQVQVSRREKSILLKLREELG